MCNNFQQYRFWRGLHIMIACTNVSEKHTASIFDDIHPEDGGTRFLQNTDNHLSDYTAS
jgi:hypothetical protein